MKVIASSIFLYLNFILCNSIIFGQNPQTLKSLEPNEEYDNIHVMNLATDSLQSAFLIWIKSEVKLHKHEWHSENVIVLEGKGELTLGDSVYLLAPGDFVNIPMNTPHAVKVTSRRPMKVLSVQSPQFLGDDRVILE